MSKRDQKLYIEDILESIDAINMYLEDVNYEKFINDYKNKNAKRH